ncbi:MAG: flagellar hook-length control protein FliK [Candidatus Obscuribacterales bacterium]|nr:flagellar hook-length control protein FliK [Steroidobacteraceae bacterium]
MRLELSSLRGPSAAGAATSLFSQWRVGAIVEAIAVRDVASGQLWLNIGNLRVPARIASGAGAGPANGERMQLRVLRDHPVVALESLVVANDEASTVNDGLRRFLPRQASPAPLMANLSHIAKQGADSNVLPRPIRLAAEHLWQALPQADELATPAGLETAVRRSGVFLEANLARQLTHSEPNDTRAMLARDVKALLIELKNALQRGGAVVHAAPTQAPAQANDPLPTARAGLQSLPTAAATLAQFDTSNARVNELAAQTDGALARLNTVQLVNAEANTNAPLLLIELPIRHGDHTESLRLRFEQHGRQHQSSEQSWTVEAALSLRNAGALHAKVSLHGNRIAVQLRAESPELVKELSTRVPELTAMLSDSGLQVERIVCLHGMPASEPDLRGAAPLLDERA